MVIQFVTHFWFFKASWCKIVLNKSWRFFSNAPYIRVNFVCGFVKLCFSFTVSLKCSSKPRTDSGYGFQIFWIRNPSTLYCSTGEDRIRLSLRCLVYVYDYMYIVQCTVLYTAKYQYPWRKETNIAPGQFYLYSTEHENQFKKTSCYTTIRLLVFNPIQLFACFVSLERLSL